MTNEQLRILQDLEEQYSFNAYVLISALVNGIILNDGTHVLGKDLRIDFKRKSFITSGKKTRYVFISFSAYKHVRTIGKEK